MRWLTFMLAALALATGARAAPPPLEAYARPPAVTAVALSPSGQRFAVAAADPSGGWNVIVRTSTGAPVAGLSFKMARIEALEFAGEDHLLIFEEQRAPLPIYYSQLASGLSYDRRDATDFNLKTRTSSFLLKGDALFGAGRWQANRLVGGRWYAYFCVVAMRGPPGFPQQLVRVDLETGKSESVAIGDKNRFSWLVGPAGEVLGSTGYDPLKQEWTVYAGYDSNHPLRRATEPNTARILSPGRTPGTIAVLERNGGATVVRELQLSGGDGAVLAKGESAISAMVDRDTALLAGFTTVQDQTLLDPRMQKRLDDARQAFPTERGRLASHSAGFGQMIFVTDGPETAGRVWFADAVGRSAAPMADLYPGIPADQVGPVSLFAYKAPDGLAMDGVLTLPPGRDAKGLPLVVMPHFGSVGEATRPTYDWWAQAFAARGYAVFQPNVRGELGRGDAFRNAADGEFGRKMQTDISDGVAALAAAGRIDPRRVCIVGAGDGGYNALAGVTLQHGVYRCAASVSGLSDPDRFWAEVRNHTSINEKLRLERLWSRLTALKIGDMNAISPAAAASSADAPVLLIHSKDGNFVLAEQTRIMDRALRRAGKQVELVEIPGFDDWSRDEVSRLAVLRASVAFVEKHNPAD